MAFWVVPINKKKKNHGILEAKADSFLLKKKKNWFFSYVNGVSDWVQVIPCTLQLVTTFFFLFWIHHKKRKKNYIGSWFLYIYVTSINMSSIKNNTYHRYKLKKKKINLLKKIRDKTNYQLLILVRSSKF